MTNATDIITYIGVPLAVLGVLPLLFNTVTCLFIRYRLLRSLPATARKFFHLHPNPVDGTVTCSFRSPQFDLHGVLDSVKNGRAPIDIQVLSPAEPHGLGASWMQLILAIGLVPRRKREVQRILVNSSLDVDSVVMKCDWRSFLFLAIGLGVNPSDPVLDDLGRGTDAIDKQTVQSLALRSPAAVKLIDIRWHKAVPHLELTAQCSSWSIRRALAHSLHMIVQRGATREILHFDTTSKKDSQVPTVQICDCKEKFFDAIDFSIVHNLHFALAWTFYFEELHCQGQRETIFIPQSLLLLQFEITQELRQISAETLESRVATVFPGNAKVVADVTSALNSTWDSSEYEELLVGLRIGVHQALPRNSQRPQQIITPPSTQLPSSNSSPDVEKGAQTDQGATNSATSPEKSLSEHNISKENLKIYSVLKSSSLFQPLFLAYSPFAAIPANRRQSSFTSLVPGSATIDIADKSKPEALLARLIIALSVMRHATAPSGWVTSIASGSLKYKVGPSNDDNMIGRLMAYEGRTVNIE